jgi:hypothetical protein
VRSQAATETPGQCREGLRARIKRILGTAAADCDTTWRSVVASTIGVTRQRVDQWLALDDDANVSVADACALPQPMRHALAAELAGEGFAVVSLPAASGDCAADLDLVMRTQRESADVIAAHLAALRDGHMSGAEGAVLEREADEMISVAMQVRECARRAQRERVVAMPLRVVVKG